MARPVRVITTNTPEDLKYCPTLEGRLDITARLLDSLEAQRPDLVCLPEVFVFPEYPWPWKDEDIRGVAGKALELVSAKARSLGSWIIAGAQEFPGGCLRNTAWLVDRSGKLIGSYHKNYPTIGEVEHGVAPGTEAPVFDTDFGKLGVAICYDIGYPDLFRRYADSGAEIMVWISAYDGGFPLRAYAWEHKYYVVSSVSGHYARIIDKTGGVLASTSRFVNWTRRILDLDREVYHLDGNVEKLQEVRDALGGGLVVESYNEENCLLLSSLDPAWPMSRVRETFGLESWDAYHRRLELLQERARSGRRP